MSERFVETPRGARVRVVEAGHGEARPIVFLHGLLGRLSHHALFLEQLARRYRVFAPELPGYGESTGEDLLEDMLDFTLHGWDVLDSLGIRNPTLVGHSLGGMIAAEMACLAPAAIDKLVLVNPFGLWLDEQPIPDVFSFLPFEFGDLLFHDPASARAVLPGATDVGEPDSQRAFLIDNARRLGTAGKILFPIPDRRLSKRLYRLRTETLVIWAEEDRLMPAAYAAAWQGQLPHATLIAVPNAGHMLPYEQPEAVVSAVAGFLG
jgi:pimeloyl-ACP methyl ester carboxylesterase